MSKNKRKRNKANDDTEGGVSKKINSNNLEDEEKNDNDIILNNTEFSEKNISEALHNFLDEEWTLVKGNLEMGEGLGNAFGKINSRRISKKIVLSPKKLIKELIPEQAFIIIMDGWNAALKEAIQNGNGTPSGKKVAKNTKSSKKLFTSTPEVREAIGSILLCSLTENSNLKKAHKEISEKYDIIKFSRLKLIVPQLGVTIKTNCTTTWCYRN